MTERLFWLAVASADHVRRGWREGFMQVSHGKRAPLGRIRPGDGVVYYSPSAVYGEKDRLQSFTAIGVVRKGEPYQGEMGDGFTPFRRDVDWADASEAPIAPLLDRLELTAGKRTWGYQLRFGLLNISEKDFRLIAEAMGAQVDANRVSGSVGGEMPTC
ncbi:EVE domain-containing protein [Mesorhizobium sp. CN2-181]|uniref:EVE domain-containing protein n=1 Tax=Mesorhizobium yinganensis TaxID=3157707 RepID=UPI0032B7156C